MSLKKFLAFTCALLVTVGFTSLTGGCERGSQDVELTPEEEERYRVPTQEEQQQRQQEMQQEGGHRTNQQPPQNN